MFPAPSSWRIVRGDTVQIMSGKDKGKQGEVIRVVRDQRFPRVFVSGINMVTRRVNKRTINSDVQNGFSVQVEAPMHYSNVMLVDPLSKKPVRTYFLYEDQWPYSRVRKTRGRNATDSIIPWPRKWKNDLKKTAAVGEKDTKLDVVNEVTYNPATDFTLKLPSAHVRVRQLTAKRHAAAAAAAAAKQQQWTRYRQSLFSIRAAASTSGSQESSSSSSSSGDSSSSSSSQRGFSTSTSSSFAAEDACCCSAAPSSAGSSPQQQHRHGLAPLPLLQRSLVRGNGSTLLCHAGLPLFMQRLSWCGLAAAPLLL